MRKLSLPTLLLFLGIYHGSNAQSTATNTVNPFIGTGGHGHVFLGANVPFGAVQAGPNNIVKGWDWCSGYHYSDSIVIGFSQTHLSGTGIGDLGDVLIMPFTGSIKLFPVKKDTLGYASHYAHDQEKVIPGLYKVHLKDDDIDVALTATKRTAMHEYVFNNTFNEHVIIDLSQGISDKTTASYIKQVDDYTLEGYRYSKGWAKDQRVYFTIRCNEKIKAVSFYRDDQLVAQQEAKGNNVKAVIDLNVKKVIFKVGISPVSTTNALGNIKTENPGWDFKTTAANAFKQWGKELGKITVSSFDRKTDTIFYTSLYHTMFAPAIFNDANGDYMGLDKKKYNSQSFTNYSIFSLWDIYRSWWPLTTLLHQDKVNDYIQSLLHNYKEQGMLPVWPLNGNETDCMIGYHSVPLITDAYLKGYKGFDAKEAFDAIVTTSQKGVKGIEDVKKSGYIPSENQVYSVSKGLEYAIDDACIAAMAKKMHQEKEYELYIKRSKLYAQYFDSSIGFMRPRMKDGSWKKQFDPFESDHENGDFVEGNSWQYTWLVPQDVHGLVQLFGGDKPFCKKLDSLFIVTGNMGENASADITGLIGMYAHGNEPSHHIAYLYAYAGEQWKTARITRQIIDQFYTAHPDGLAGNEDCGAMSAWYIFSAMGFYPVQPASGIYVLGSPILNAYSIHLPGSKKFEVTVKNNSSKNIYIQSIMLNGKPYNKSYITHNDITQGGSMIITMADHPNYNFGKPVNDRP